MKKIVASIIAALLIAAVAYAGDLRVAHVFSDHAVLQRETSAPVWGWGKPGAKVAVKASWSGRTVRTTVAPDGTWKVSVATDQAGGPYTLRISSGSEKITLEDIWLGEVWVCSGQSNMEMPMGGYGFQQVDGYRDHLLEAAAYSSRVRVFDIKADTTHVAQTDVDAAWALTTPGVMTRTSAVGYMFAKRLATALDVPVGIIVNAWGGSRIEPWMPMEAVEDAGLTPSQLSEVKALREKTGTYPLSVATCWNGRMKPVAGYAARGFLWYQGCSNIGQDYYDKLQASMVRYWRKVWGRDDMPFIYALLAPYHHGDADGRWRPHFVRTQIAAQGITPLSWAVCLETLGDPGTVHPSRKQEAADLMCMRALASVYGVDLGITIDFPEPWAPEYREDGHVRIRFGNVWSNFEMLSDVRGFELAGEDRQFHLAKAAVDWDGQTVDIWCPEVPHPVAVRYGFRNYMDANLQTTFGIAVPPFRSDDWEY